MADRKKIPVIVAAVLLAGAAALGFRPSAAERRPLLELGTVSLPARLDPFPPIEKKNYTLFPFDRTADSFLLMGSNRPVPEKIVVAVWTPETREEARNAARNEAAERTGKVVWRNDAAYKIGEGLHEVNTAENPNWIVVRDFEDHQLTVAYMVWKKAESLDQAKRIVDDAGKSFQRSLSNEDYLTIARERPEKQRKARQSAMDAALAARGLHLTFGSAPVEKNGLLYVMYRHHHYGEMLATLRPLGSMPRARRYRHLRPELPKGVGDWPRLLWFEKSEGGWARREVDDSDPILPDGFDTRIGARHASRPSESHFYTIDVLGLQETDDPSSEMERFERTSVRMAELFGAGKLVRAEP